MARAKNSTESVETVSPGVKVEDNVRSSGIKVQEPLVRLGTNLPPVIILPPGASEAQIERARVLNGFAYQFPKKWEERKEKLLKELEDLQFAPPPRGLEDGKLTVGTTPKL